MVKNIVIGVLSVISLCLLYFLFGLSVGEKGNNQLPELATKLYSNQKFGFSLELPQNFTASETSDGFLKISNASEEAIDVQTVKDGIKKMVWSWNTLSIVELVSKGQFPDYRIVKRVDRISGAAEMYYTYILIPPEFPRTLDDDGTGLNVLQFSADIPEYGSHDLTEEKLDSIIKSIKVIKN
ncbi:MAG: hypothetical protein EXS46_03470 [Candidatus Taylorbacteria bacterium]|nr:hypothetical protein [Candidatus Taylorbacteria bacterium]